MPLTKQDIKRLPLKWRRHFEGRLYKTRWGSGFYLNGYDKPQRQFKRCESCERENAEQAEKYGQVFNRAAPKATNLAWLTESYEDFDYDTWNPYDPQSQPRRFSVVVEPGRAVCEDHIPLRQKAIAALIKQRGQHHDNWLFMEHWYWRLFYTVKATICILLDRDRNSTPTRPVCGDNAEFLDGMALFDSHAVSDMDCWERYDWTEVSVGKGIFSNWYYEISGNSSC